MNKRTARLRRAKRTRKHIQKLSVPRLTVHRTLQHIYAQIIVKDNEQHKVVASASSLDKEIRGGLNGSKSDKATLIGKALAERAIAAGIKAVAFDRSGFKFHGRIKAVAEGAREAGLEF